MLERVFLDSSSTKTGLMCLAQGHNTVTTVRFESAATMSVDLSRTEAGGQGHNDLEVVIDISRPNMYPHTKGYVQ